MAEYYPLLAKAIGSLPNSTADTRRVVYERARKALIGQLRTLHPPVPDEDIEKESVELDRAVERLESELAAGVAAAPPSAPARPSPPAPRPPAPPSAAPTAPPPPPAATPPGAPADRAAPLAPPRSPPALRPRPPLPERKPITPRTPLVRPEAKSPPPPAEGAATLPSIGGAAPTPNNEVVDALSPVESSGASAGPATSIDAEPVDTESTGETKADGKRRLKPPQRPIAPQPTGSAPKRRLWIIPVVVAAVVAIVAVAAWKLRDRPETLARKPAESSQGDSGKIAERVGGPASSTPSSDAKEDAAPAPSAATQPSTDAQTQTKAPANPELPVARRAALLVEAPDEASKVKTFVGNVVWKLNNAPQGANAAVGLAVEADVDLPDDKMKAIVTFEKNTDASLPASHTIKIRFVVEPGSFSGNVKQISVPQMRPEASPNGEPLAGVTVQIVPNSFLVGLSPGNAEAANIDLMRRLQWVDIPMLLDSGKIAKLTFEKGDSGRRDLDEAFDAWQK